jgi:hypothetical protein
MCDGDGEAFVVAAVAWSRLPLFAAFVRKKR